jgi:hypothetical protein
MEKLKRMKSMERQTGCIWYSIDPSCSEVTNLIGVKFQDWTAENPADVVDEQYEVLSVVSERSVRIQTNCARYSVVLWKIIGMGSNRTTDIWDTGDTEWSVRYSLIYLEARLC